MNISERNKLRGTVTAVDEGAAIGKVTLDLGDNVIPAPVLLNDVLQ
jgi:molybdopterin-binding protein